MKITSYTLEEAITVMRNCTTVHRTFSIKFLKLDGGKTIISKCSLRPMASTSKDKNGKYKLQLVNDDTGAYRQCYIPLIMEVNGIKVK